MTVLKYFITSKAKRNVLYLFMRNPGKRYYTREVARLTGEPLNAVRRELGYLEKAGLFTSCVQGNLKYYEIVKSFPLLAQWRKIILESGAAPSAADIAASVTDVVSSEAKQSADHADIAPKGEVTKRPPEIKHLIAITESFKHVPVEEGDKPIISGARVIPNHEPLPLPDVIELPAHATTGDAAADTIARSEARDRYSEPKPRTILTLQSVVDHLRDQLKDINTINLALIHGEAAKLERIPENGLDLLIVGDINKDALMELISNFEDTTGINVNLTSMTRSDFDYRNARGDAFVRRIWGEKKLAIKGRQ